MKLVTCLLCILLSSRVLGAQVDDFEARRKQGTDMRLAALEEHSAWLLNQKLTGTRLELLAIIIEFDPDNDSARRSLGYKPKQGGGWIPPRKPKKSSDQNPRSAKLEPERRAQALKPFLDYHLALLEEAKADVTQRMLLARDMLRLDPDNAELHLLLGEVKGPNGWVSQQTLIVDERRALIAKTLEAALESKAKASQATPKEAAFPVSWSGVLDTPDGRVLGTVASDELQTCAKQLQAVMALYRLVIDPSGEVPEGFAIFMMQNKEEADAFLSGVEAVPAEQRPQFVEQMGLWLTRTQQVAHWSDEPERRRDAVARLLIQHLLRERMGATLKNPWLSEGFGLYLGFLVTGTRLTWFLPCEESPKWTGEESARLEMLYAKDWRHLGARYLEHPARPKLAEVVTQGQADFSALHLLYSYLLADFLAEAFPNDVGSVIRAVGNGARAELVFERRLKKSMAEMELGFEQWIRRYASTHAPEPPSEEQGD